jgi:hypothetical protein
VLGDLAAAQHPVRAQGDLVLAAQRPAFPLDGCGEFGQVSFGGLEEALALAGPTSSRSLAAVSIPRSPTSTTRVRANRFLSLLTWLATVFGSPVLPSNTSMATGTPPLEVSSP